MYNSSAIPTLLDYIEENKKKPEETPKISFIQKTSWTFYIFSFFLAFAIIPKVIEIFFSYHSLILNIFIFLLFIYLTFEFRRSILPKKKIIKNNISQKFKNIITLISSYGFSNTSSDIENILKCSPNVFQLNKEYILIIDEALSKYIQIIIKISNLSYKTISSKNGEKTSNQNLNLNSQEIDTNFLKHFQKFSRKNFKNYSHNLHLGNFQNKPFEFSIPGVFEIHIGKNTIFIDIAGIIKLGQGKEFEGIEILKGLILIGRNENFDGIILGSIKLGKDLVPTKESSPVQNQALSGSSNQQMSENNFCAHATSNFLSNNPELKLAAENACKQIAEIRVHCEDIIVNDIHNDLNKTTFNLNEKIDREKRIMNEMGKI